MSVSPGFLAPDAFYFAFPQAINLAEAGRKIDDKRIGCFFIKQATYGELTRQLPGYLFCSEMMPINHELRLMLVNSLRKVSSFERCGADRVTNKGRILKVMKYPVSAWLWITSS